VADKSELLHLAGKDSGLMLSKARTSLIARARKDCESLILRKRDSKLLAPVKLNDRWGLIDTDGRFVVSPIYFNIEPYSCGLAAFSTSFTGMVLWNFGPEVYRGRGPSEANLSTSFGPRSAGQWGFLDYTGKTAIHPKFDHVRAFCEDAVAVSVSGKWGFINKAGEFITELVYAGAGDFKDGRAIVQFDEKCGLIDQSGTFVVEPRFDYLWEFSEGLACAEVGRKYGYIDCTGAFVINPRFDSAGDFRNGIASVRIEDRICAINRAGEAIFECEEETDSLGDFIDGVARVSSRQSVYASECGHDGECTGVCDSDPCSCEASDLECDQCSSDCAYYVDMTGRRILQDDRLHAIDDFSDGCGIVGLPQWDWDSGRNNYLHGYVNSEGKVTIPPKFSQASRFEGERAAVSANGEVWILIDKNGAPIGDLRFDGLDDFHEGLARIETEQSYGFYGKYGFIDRDGSIIVEPKFAWLTPFRNGIARFSDKNGVCLDKSARWGFIDRSGTIIVPCQFEDARDFQTVEH